MLAALSDKIRQVNRPSVTPEAISHHGVADRPRRNVSMSIDEKIKAGLSTLPFGLPFRTREGLVESQSHLNGSNGKDVMTKLKRCVPSYD